MGVTFKADIARVASPAIGSSYSSGLNGDGQAISSRKRSFSSFFAAVRSLFPKSGTTAPAETMPARVAPEIASLQWSKFDASAASGCILCTVDFLRLNRVRQIVGILPVGFNVIIPTLCQVLEVPFSIALSDLNYLVHQVGLPIKGDKKRFKLSEPICLCKSCAQIGERVRQTERFRKYFKATTTVRFGGGMKTTNLPPPGTCKAA